MINNNKTLIILSPGFPENEADTVCLPFLQTFIKTLNQNSPRLKIIVLAFQYPYIRSEYLWNNNQVISFNGRQRKKLHRLFLWFQVWRTLKELYKKENIIGLFSLWFTECALVGKYFGKYYKIKHRTWLCGQDAKKGNKYVSFSKPKPEELIAMSDFLQDEFYKNYNIKPVHLIPVGIDPSLFNSVQQVRDIDILGAGYLNKVKRYDLFINIVDEVRHLIPNIHSFICGNGAEEEKLKRLLANLSIENNVSLLGELPHKEVLHLMQRAKIFLHTSSYEGFGTVCMEALYAGAHVISFTKPMKREIQNWHIVKSKDEMIEKILEILQDKNTIYQSVLLYTIDEVAQTIIGLY